MRASLEALRASTATLATDLEQHAESYRKLGDVSTKWREQLEASGQQGEGREGA